MPVLVNGTLIPKEAIREEEQRLAQRPEWRDVPEGLEKSLRLRAEAESRLIDHILLDQECAKDTRPLDAALVTSEVERLRTANGCRVVVDDGPLRQQIEADLRLRRTVQELMDPVRPVRQADIVRFYQAERRNFKRPETVHAAHIVKHIDETRTEEEARAGIEAALAELQRGELFAAVADRHSDCKGNGGDLGSFPRGHMVEEFDNVVFALQPGQRSPVFRTPFGFHIAELRSRAPAGIAPLRDVQSTIEEFLAATNERSAFERAMRGLRAKADIRRVSTRQAGAQS